MFDALNMPHYVFLSFLSAGLKRNSSPKKEKFSHYLLHLVSTESAEQDMKKFLEIHNKTKLAVSSSAAEQAFKMEKHNKKCAISA